MKQHKKVFFEVLEDKPSNVIFRVLYWFDVWCFTRLVKMLVVPSLLEWFPAKHGLSLYHYCPVLVSFLGSVKRSGDYCH